MVIQFAFSLMLMKMISITQQLQQSYENCFQFQNFGFCPRDEMVFGDRMLYRLDRSQNFGIGNRLTETAIRRKLAY